MPANTSKNVLEGFAQNTGFEAPSYSVLDCNPPFPKLHANLGWPICHYQLRKDDDKASLVEAEDRTTGDVIQNHLRGLLMANFGYSDIRFRYLSSYRRATRGREDARQMGLCAHYLEYSCEKGHLAVVTFEFPHKQ